MFIFSILPLPYIIFVVSGHFHGLLASHYYSQLIDWRSAVREGKQSRHLKMGLLLLPPKAVSTGPD